MKNFLSLIFLTFSFLSYSQNVAPTVSDATATVTEGGGIDVNLSISDDDGDSWTISIVSAPSVGTTEINPGDQITYTHDGSEGNVVTFTYRATDSNNNESSIATVTITVTGVNDMPTVEEITKTVDENSTTEIILSGNDAEGSALVYSLVTQPNDGTFTFDTATGVGSYVHNGNENASDTFSYKVCEDGTTNCSSSQNIVITITNVNDAPIVFDSNNVLSEGTSIQTTLSFSDPEGSDLTVSVSSDGANGTSTISGSDIIYTHDGSDTTSDSVTFSVSDGTLSTTGTITFIVSPVNDAPTGVADTYYISLTDTLKISSKVGVLRNDTDSDSKFETISSNLGSTSPTSGSLEFNSDGSFSYIANSTTSFNSDTFSYIPSDGSSSGSEVTVTLEVVDITVDPDAYDNEEASTLDVTAANGLLSNDKDVNNLTLTAALDTSPLYGTLTLAADGSFSYVHDGSENLRDVFTYNVTNANGDISKTSFAVITHTNVNDSPTSAGTALTINEGASSTFTPTYIDTDTDLSSIVFTITGDVSNGSLVNNGDGTFSYSHAGTETSSDSFVYSVSDGEFTVSDLVGTISVTAVNDVPVVSALEYTLDEAGSQVLAFASTDAESDSVTYSVSTDPTNGTVVSSDGVFTYTHNGSESSSDTFQYIANDGTGDSQPVSVTITVSPVNDAPVVTAGTISLNEGSNSSITLSASDAEGDAMTYAIATAPTNGTVTLDAATGALTYTHSGGENTSDTFTFTSSDSALTSSAGTVTVTVTAVNDAPVISADTFAVDQFDEVTFNIPATDAEGNSLTYTIETDPTKGTLLDNGGGSFTYFNNTPTSDYTDASDAAEVTTDTFVVKANDGSLDSADTTLTFNVTEIDTTIPQVLLTSSASSMTETSDGSASLTVNAVLISNDFYSVRRDMNAAPVSAGAENSLGLIYIGESNGKKYYVSKDECCDNNSVNGREQYSTASTAAKNFGGYLAVFETETEQTNVNNLLKEQSLAGNDFWIGYQYNYESPAGFIWANGWTGGGSTMYTDSGSFNVSDSPVSRRYVYFRSSSSSDNGTWFNTDSGNYRYILEFDNNVAASSDVDLVLSTAGTASIGSSEDYSLSASTLTISAGQSSASITINEGATDNSDSDADEPTETIIITAALDSEESDARIKSSQKTLSIDLIDDDNTAVTWSSGGTITEGSDSSVSLTATLNNVKPFDTAITLDISGTATVEDDYSSDDDGFITTVKQINEAYGLVQDSNGNIYVSSSNSRQIFKIDTSGNQTTYAGTGGWEDSVDASATPVSLAKFREIKSMAIDTSGDDDILYLADQRVIKKINLTTNLVYYITGDNQTWQNSFTNGEFDEAFFGNIEDITVSNDGASLYILDQNAIRKITDLSGDGSVTTISGQWDWDYKDGTLSQARFEGPQGIDMDSSGNLWVRQYGKLRKVDLSADAVTTVLSNMPWGSGDLTIDSSNTIYFADRNEARLYEYSITNGDLYTLIDSSNDRGTVDGITKNAKIERPTQLLATASALYFTQRLGGSDGGLRKIDFINKLRIPAGQSSGTFTLSIIDDGVYETAETINVKVTAAENIQFDSTNVVEYTLADNDTAPKVSLVSSADTIAEEGGKATLTFQLGDASESGGKLDMSPGLKSSYIYLGEKDNHKYYLSDNHQSYTNAKQIATDAGGYLTAIDSASENSFIRDQMESAGYNWESVWIGFNDEETEGTFKWVNGSKSTYVNWQNGEPNNSGGREDYTELMNNGYWNDLPNDHNRRYVVEFSGSISSVDTVIEYAVTGSDGYETEFDNIVGSGSVTISAGQSVKTVEIAASSDTANDPIDSITYTITGVTGDSEGAQLGTDLSKTVRINDNDAPVLSWAASGATLEEDSGTVSVTATIEGSITKLSSSTLNVNVNPSSDDTAVYGLDYEIVELNQVSTFAGSGQTGSNDGIGTDAKFRYPMGSVLDASGNLYVADNDNNLIRKIDTSGNVTTWAGNGDWAHDRNEGSKLDVGFARPAILVFDASYNMYVAENGRQRISKIDTAGNVTHVSGNGDWGDASGDKNSTQFRNISGMAFDNSGNLFVSERDNHKVKRITFDPSSGAATSEDWVGSGSYDYANGNGTDASFRHPWGIAIDASDNLYVSDHNNHRIRKVSPSKDVTDYAGNGNWGQKDGSLATARFRHPGPLTFDSNGDLWVADQGSNTIIKIDVSEGYVSRFAGKVIDNNSHADGTLDEAKFSRPSSISLNSTSIFVVDNESHRVRKIDLLPSITIPATQTSASITLRGIDDYSFENAESITLGAGSTTNVDATSSFANLSITLNSGDPLPVVRLSSQEDVLDETGTVELKVSLSDSFSSSKLDMSQGSKSEFFYLGEYNGSKYYSSRSNDRLQFDDANARAAELGGQLAVITSSGEQDFIVNGIYNNDPDFSVDNNRWLSHWIGLEYDKDDDTPVWEWSNGIVSNYSAWVDEWQEKYDNNREAAYLHTDGTWHSNEKRNHRRFVIEFSSAISDANTTVALNFEGSTATADTDFTSDLSSGEVVIPAGNANATVTLTGISGDGDEPIETVTVNLASADGGTLSDTDNSASFNINDSDLPVVTLSIENDVTEISENGGVTNLIATLSNAKLNAVSIPFTFESSGDKIAIFDKDYESTDINKVSDFLGDGNRGFLNASDLNTSQVRRITGMTSDPAGNIYLADQDNNSIRKIDSNGTITTWAGDGDNFNDQPDAVQFRTDTNIGGPRSIVFDSTGNAFIASEYWNLILKVDTSGNVTRFSGTWDHGRNNGEVSQATYQGPLDLVFDSQGNLFVLERHSIRKIEFSGDAASVSDFVGDGNWGDNDGTGTEARFGDVRNFTIDSNDNIYFADGAHSRIKKVTPEGVVTTIAGNGNWDFADGFGSGARFRQPHGISIDSDDNLFIADSENSRIRKIELTADNKYKVSTLAGNGNYGSVNGVGSEAEFKRPAVTFENNGILYVYLEDETKIKKIDLNPQITIAAGETTASFNISGIDDISYESTETISITPSVSGGTLASSDPLSLSLTSDDAIPSVKISTENSILKENGGTVQVNVVLTDASGGTGAWKNSDLPVDAQNDYDFVGEYKGHKYYFSKFNSSWTVANQNALELGGQMLVIDDMEEQNFVNTIMIHNGTWVGTKSENGSWVNNYGDSTFNNFEPHHLDAPQEVRYVRTYGNWWYPHDNNDNGHFIVEFGPVKTSELPSSVNLVFSGDATGEDYTSSVTETITVPAGSQSASFILTGVDDALDESIETISIALADPQNIELSVESSLDIEISDDEAPVVSFTTSATEIPENNGSTVVTATLSNAKLEPTTVNLGLEGSSTTLIDYNVSAIYGYSNFAGQTDNGGSRDGIGEGARFSDLRNVIQYVDNTLLVADKNSHTIKRIAADGSVSRFIGKDYQCGGDRNGNALEAQICNVSEIAADLSNGNVFWVDGHIIMGYNASDGQISEVFDGNSEGLSWFGGITVLNGEIYVSEFDREVIHKLSWNGSGFDRTIVAGVSGQGFDWRWWMSPDELQPRSATEPSLRAPSWLSADPVSNKIYIGKGIYDWGDPWSRSHVSVWDLNSNTVSYISNTAWYLYETIGNAQDAVPLGKPSIDSSGKVYFPSDYGPIVIMDFTDDGQDYVSQVLNKEEVRSPKSTAILGQSLYVANQNTIGKLGLGATIDIAAGTNSNTITLSAFKDVSFEEDETIDIKVGSISNGTSESNDIEVVTIIESTRLTKVDSPFEGVENGKVSWGDYDRDGDMDLLLMGQGSDGTITNVYRNDGNDESGNPKFVNTNQNFTKYIGGDIEFVDVDQDGWLDVAVTGVSPQGRKSELYMNRNGEFFELNTDYVVEGLSQSDMEWADLDDDSDQDLIITGIDSNNQTQSYYYTNLGNFNFFKEELFKYQAEGVQRGEIDIVDRDKDGDNDLFISGVNNNENIRRMEFNNTYYYYNPQNNVGTGLADGNTEYLDIDGDGELDYLTIGRREDNSEQVFVESNLMTFNLPSLKNTDFDFADYNNDGMSDLIITGEDQNSGVAVSKLYLTFKELYGSEFRLIESDLTLDGLRESSADWIDYDSDGDLDLFLTGLDVDGKPKSILYKAENRFNTNQAPTAPKNVQAFPYGGNGNMYIQWESPDDDNSSSFRYAVRIGTEPGASDILYANSITDTESANFGSTLIDIPGLLTRNNINVQVLPGTYYISVQAIDGGNIGGPFSEEISVEADYAWNLQRLGGIIDRRLDTDESSQIKFMDMDKDGDMDLIGSNVGTRYSGRQAINILAFQNDIFQPKKGFSGGDSTFEIADFNNDGNEDIIMSVDEGNGSRITVLLNTYDQDEERVAQGEGGGREYFTPRNFFEDDNFFPSLFNVKFAIKDLNNDGLLEIIAAGESSKISSEATAKIGIVSINPFNEDNSIGFDNFTFSEVTDLGGEELTSLSFSSYDFGDIDNDGDFDFLISGYSFDGYKTYLYENKRKLDENGAVVQPVEVNYELTDNNFVSVKDGTTQFVDIDQDGKLDIIFSGQSSEGDVFRAYKNTGNIDNFASIDIGLPAVRNGNFIFGDIFGEGRNDVIFSGTVTGQGTFSRLAFLPPGETKYIESNYDLFVDNGKIGLADFDGDLDTDLVLTGKWRNDLSNNDYRGFVYINVRGYAGDAGVANNNNDDIKTSSVNGVKQQSNDGASSSGSSLNTRPEPPTSISYQRQRIGDKTYEVVINWNSGTDKETPDEGLTYSLMIGTSEGAQDILASGANSEGVRATGTKGNAENNKSWKVVLKEGEYHVAVQSVDASFIGSKFSESFKFTVANSTKLGDSNGDDSVNILDLTSNVDYILGNTPAVFVNEVADVNGDGKIDVADISGIVNIIMNGTTGAAQGSIYDPYVWEYFSNKPVGDATLVRRDGRIFLENDKPVTSLQFSIDSTVEYELSEELENLTVVNFIEDNKRTFLIYSLNNQPIDEVTDIIFDYLDLNDGDDFEINDMTAGTNDGLLLNLKYSDESFFDDSENVIQIYPNPAVSNVNLLTDITKKVETIEVDIYNVLGVSVYKTSIDSMGRLNDLDVSMLSSGVYTVRVRMVTDKNEEIINVHKLIKK